MNIRRGTTVAIMAGKDKGKQGTVERVLADSHQVVVTGINIAKRHIKPNSKYPAGGIIEIPQPMDQSNVKVLEGHSDTASKPKSTKKTK